MLNIKLLARKLRHAANVLDELFEVEGTPAIAKQILKSQGPGKGHPRKGLHWTQRPENKKKLLAMSARSAATRLKKDRIKAVDDARLKPGWAAVSRG